MHKQLSILDWCILAATLAISILVGLFHGCRHGRQKTTAEFLTGNRNMPLIPTVLSLLVSFQSGILILGLSSELYMKGITFFYYLIGCLVALPVAAVTFVPIFYRLKLTSVFEYLELRFHSKLVRYIGNLLWMFGFIVYMGIVLYAPATAMSAVSNMPLEILLVVTVAVCIFYTMIGGIKAVVWTDAFQSVIMYCGLLAIMIEGFILTNGPRAAFQTALDDGRLYTETTADPFVYMNVWLVVVEAAVAWMMSYCVNQASVQRYCSVSSLSKAKWSVGLMGPALLLMSPLAVFCGLVVYAYYANCDPLTTGQIENRDQLLPFFVLDAMDHIPGLPGLFIACLYSGTLSTISTGINSVSAVIWEDYIKFFSKKTYSDRVATMINQGLVVLFGLVALGLAFVAQFMGGVFQAAMTVLIAIGSPGLGLFLYGIIFPWANRKGALAGVTVSAVVTGWICVGAQVIKPYRESLPRSIDGCAASLVNSTLQHVEAVTNPSLEGMDYIYKLSYKAYGLVGTFLVLIVGVLVSLCTTKDWKIPDDQKPLFWSGWYYIFRPVVPKKYIENLNPRRQRSTTEQDEQGQLLGLL